jgi:tetratricopeptide (TPR) repeat protein
VNARQVITTLAAALLVSLTSAAAPLPGEQQIHKLYQRGLSGDKEAVEQCIATLEAVLQSQPNNQRARVYLGSAYTLRSRDLPIGPQKIKVLRQGLAVMDEAVAAAPNEPKVRLTRALTNQALPGFLGRSGSAREDFRVLAAAAEQTPQKFERGDLQLIFYNAALAAKKNGDRTRAAELLRKAQRHSADATLARKVEAEIATL